MCICVAILGSAYIVPQGKQKAPFLTTDPIDVSIWKVVKKVGREGLLMTQEKAAVYYRRPSIFGLLSYLVATSGSHKLLICPCQELAIGGCICSECEEEGIRHNRVECGGWNL